MSTFLVWLRDVAEQAAVAFVAAVLAMVPVDLAGVDLSWARKAAIAGVVAALVVVKGALAKFVGNSASASVQPKLPEEQVEAVHDARAAQPPTG